MNLSIINPLHKSTVLPSDLLHDYTKRLFVPNHNKFNNKRSPVITASPPNVPHFCLPEKIYFALLFVFKLYSIFFTQCLPHKLSVPDFPTILLTFLFVCLFAASITVAECLWRPTLLVNMFYVFSSTFCGPWSHPEKIIFIYTSSDTTICTPVFVYSFCILDLRAL